MQLNRVLVYQTGEMVYSFAYANDKLVYVLQDDLNEPATESLFNARVSRVNHKSGSAFVEYLPGLSGWINLKAGKTGVQNGSNIVCQLAWHGDTHKQAKLRPGVQLAGKYVVWLDDDKFALQSKKLSEAKKEELLSRTELNHGRWILRSSVNDESDLSLVVDEINMIKEQIQSIKASNSLGLISAGKRNYLKLLRSFRLESGFEFITNSETIYDEIRYWQDLWQIDVISFDPKLNLTNNIDEYSQLLNQSIITLANGATLALASLHGIHVIDVNSSSLDMNAFTLNNAVIEQIYQQICLRNLLGIILIDFVKNMNQEEQGRIITKLNKLFASDVTSTKILGFSHAGLCEIIRNKF